MVRELLPVRTHALLLKVEAFTSARQELAPSRIRAHLRGCATLLVCGSLLMAPASMGQYLKKSALEMSITATSSRCLMSLQSVLAAV